MITVDTSRPVLLLARAGQEVDKLKEELKKDHQQGSSDQYFSKSNVRQLDAKIVAVNIARQIEGKIAYRRATKMAIASRMRMEHKVSKFRFQAA